jgi:hypothetical protein
MDLCCLIDSKERLAATDLVTMLGDLLERGMYFSIHHLTFPFSSYPQKQNFTSKLYLMREYPSSSSHSIPLQDSLWESPATLALKTDLPSRIRASSCAMHLLIQPGSEPWFSSVSPSPFPRTRVNHPHDLQSKCGANDGMPIYCQSYQMHSNLFDPEKSTHLTRAPYPLMDTSYS